MIAQGCDAGCSPAVEQPSPPAADVRYLRVLEYFRVSTCSLLSVRGLAVGVSCSNSPVADALVTSNAELYDVVTEQDVCLTCFETRSRIRLETQETFNNIKLDGIRKTK